MSFHKTLTASTAALALALAAAPLTVLTAQSAVAQEAAEYSGDQLDAFTSALIEVASVREKYTPLLQSAETEDQQAAIIEEANAEITDVIETADGITMDSYLEIAQAASQDQALNQRIIKRVQAQNETLQ
jgi:fibrillarin-like rRNA methylase